MISLTSIKRNPVRLVSVQQGPKTKTLFSSILVLPHTNSPAPYQRTTRKISNRVPPSKFGFVCYKSITIRWKKEMIENLPSTDNVVLLWPAVLLRDMSSSIFCWLFIWGAFALLLTCVHVLNKPKPKIRNIFFNYIDTSKMRHLPSLPSTIISLEIK